MSSEMDDLKKRSLPEIEENNFRHATTDDGNELSVMAIDESQLLGTDLRDNDQNSILDEEALLRSPEVSYVGDENPEQHSVINEDKLLIQQSHSTTEEISVKDSAVEECFAMKNSLVASLSHVEGHSVKTEDFSPDQDHSDDKNLLCSHMELDNNNSGALTEENARMDTGAETLLNLQSENTDTTLYAKESDSTDKPSEFEMQIESTVDQQATVLKEEEIFENKTKTECDSEDENGSEITSNNLVAESDISIQPDRNNSETLQNEILAIASEANINVSVNEEEEAQISEGKEGTEYTQRKQETEIEEKERTEVVKEYFEIPPIMQTSSPEVKSNEINLIHHIKNIQFKDSKIGIVTQNENGPCPLVAIINVLLLKHLITLPALCEIVSASKLMEYIGNTILENIPKNLSGEARLNYEQNMHDAMAVLPKLQTGLDVNVRFTGVRDFEYTPECIIFDLLRIPLYHGWLVDPQTPETVAAIGNASYNQIVEKAISQKCCDNADSVTEALIIENFLERTASQLTYHGLSELNSATSEDEIGVLFRNNHFSTIYKHGNELLQLVTDQGFLTESSVVWETLSSIDGDGQFVDGHFRTVPPKPECTTSTVSPPTESSLLTAEQQIDQDFLVALSLQDQPETPQEELTNPTTMTNDKTTQEFLDAKLARQLQREEERQAAEAEANRGGSAQTTRPAETPHAKKKDGCTIL